MDEQDQTLPVVVEVGALTATVAKAQAYAKAAKSESTRRAYRSDWHHFENWCSARDLVALPAEPVGTVLRYLVENAKSLKVSSLQRRLVAIREAHRYAGIELDTTAVVFRDTWRGLRRVEGQARPTVRKQPILTAMLRSALRTLPATLQGHRDRALLLIGFGAGLRRAELASLEVVQRDGAAGWIEDRQDGIAIKIAFSKTDQEAEGEIIGVPMAAGSDLCPVAALRAWLAVSGITEGPLFRPITRHGRMGGDALSGNAVAKTVQRIVLRAALAEGLTPEEAQKIAVRFAGHSLRAGHATSAAMGGAPGHAIQRQLRHKNFQTTAGYIREGSLFQGNSASYALK